MQRTFKYRLFPNVSQTRELCATLETHRRLYNQALDNKQLCWETAGVDWTFVEQSRWFTIQKRSNPYFARINSWSALQTLRKLDKAFVAFFRRAKSGLVPGYPRFKGRDRFDSFVFDYGGKGGGCRIVSGKLRLQHIGTIRVRWHRDLPMIGTINQVVIKRDGDNWYACFVVKTADVEPSSRLDAVGLDVGLESFLTTSLGESEPNPAYLRTALPKLRRTNRGLARKRRGGSNRKKAARSVRRLHRRVRNLRREHHHQTSAKLIHRYGLIAVERLNIQGMVKNARMSRAIADAGWYSFIAILKGKAEGAGVQVVEVDPRGTSQLCSSCGSEVRKALFVRWHDCSCGCSIHRDHNAALNILARARQVRTEPAGVNVADYRERSPRSLRLTARK